MPFLHQESTCIQVCPDYGKNLLFALVQKWPFRSHVLACLKPNQILSRHAVQQYWVVTLYSNTESSLCTAILGRHSVQQYWVVTLYSNTESCTATLSSHVQQHSAVMYSSTESSCTATLCRHVQQHWVVMYTVGIAMDRRHILYMNKSDDKCNYTSTYIFCHI